MQVQVQKVVSETKDLTCARYATIPTWAGRGRCDKCHYEIEASVCVVAEDEQGSRYYFHTECFNP